MRRRFCANNRHVNRRSNASRKGSARRHSSLGPIAGGVPSATPGHGNFSLRAAAVSLRQTESPPRFGGLPCRCSWLIRFMPPSITRTVAAGMLGDFLVRGTDLDGLHPSFRISPSLVDSAGRAHNGHRRLGRFLVDDGAFLGLDVLHDIELIGCEKREQRTTQPKPLQQLT